MKASCCCDGSSGSRTSGRGELFSPTGNIFSASALSCCIATAKSGSCWAVLLDIFVHKKFPNCLDQTLDVVTTRFDVDLETMISRRFRRDRSDACNLHSFWPEQAECEKIFHRGRTGERDQIRPLFQKPAARAGNVARLRNRTIGKSFIDNRSQLRQFPRKHVPRLFCARQEDSQIFYPALP